ncbi:MAG: response regulator, partial [Gammaproteobacteria bacterium]
MGEAQQITDRGNAALQGRKTIVIADDDRTVRNVLARVLEISGYETVPVESGEACLTEAHNRHVDAFVVDVYMPGMDGLSLCRQLRADHRFRHVPILMMTAGGEAQHVDAAFESGADDFIVKPVNPTILGARLRGQI